MELYLMRHGAAVNVGEQGARTDAERMLSAEGVEKTTAVARGLKAAGLVDLERVIASPLVRARQTAEIVARVLAPRIEVELADELAPGADPPDVVRWLRSQREARILLVGHMPDLSVLASYLIAGSDRGCIEFKKAGIAKITFDHAVQRGAGCLEWLLPPGLLRRLA